MSKPGTCFEVNVFSDLGCLGKAAWYMRRCWYGQTGSRYLGEPYLVFVYKGWLHPLETRGMYPLIHFTRAARIYRSNMTKRENSRARAKIPPALQCVEAIKNRRSRPPTLTTYPSTNQPLSTTPAPDPTPRFNSPMRVRWRRGHGENANANNPQAGMQVWCQRPVPHRNLNTPVQ